ncbi:LysM peptidoglycan-binding domain-containing protein [Vogesella fluminis]|uniref:LysM peptidoglycan-binding domain-containing protein n=1 Tax=Vogesella fluminis TaxID=1069161 RepID=UPI00363CDCB2
MFKAIIPLILALGLSATAFADTLVLRPDAPPRYEVKRGDTLWDISGRYLTAPWKWPQLWDMNRDEVKNPHWIYPGNVLYLEMVDGKPRLRLDSSALRVVKLSPRVRTEQLDSAIPTIPARIIDPFLKRPLLIEDEASYLQSPKIIAGPDNRVILSTTDRAYSQGWMPAACGRPTAWGAPSPTRTAARCSATRPPTAAT